jgi:hypothetical protein
MPDKRNGQFSHITLYFTLFSRWYLVEDYQKQKRYWAAEGNKKGKKQEEGTKRGGFSMQALDSAIASTGARG